MPLTYLEAEGEATPVLSEKVMSGGGAGVIKCKFMIANLLQLCLRKITFS